MIILGKFGDVFVKSLYEVMRKYRENVSYHPFKYEIFPNDEFLPRFCDEPYMAITAGGEIRFPPGARKLRSAIRNDPNVVVVVRGASGYKWKPVHEVMNAHVASRYLKEEMGVEHLILVLPNMPFGKQDHIFYDKNTNEMMDGDPITLKYARELLRYYADLLISFNPHDFRDSTGWIIKNETTIPGAIKDEQGRILDSKGRVFLQEAENWTGFAYAIDSIPLLARYLISTVKNPLFIGPDRTVENTIRRISDRVFIADKVRDKHDRFDVVSEIKLPDDMNNYDAVLLDDLIQAGSTMNNIIRELNSPKRPFERRPRSTTCAAVHGEFVFNRKLGRSAYDILKESGAQLVVTDTIETPVSIVSVVPLLAEELHKLSKLSSI